MATDYAPGGLVLTMLAPLTARNAASKPLGDAVVSGNADGDRSGAAGRALAAALRNTFSSSIDAKWKRPAGVSASIVPSAYIV